MPKRGRAEYLFKKNLNIKEKRVLANFRVGGFVKAAEYWRELGEKWCRLCGVEQETVTHLLQDCILNARRDKVARLLDESGEGGKVLLQICKQVHDKAGAVDL